jgi:mRNA interferase MazF
MDSLSRGDVVTVAGSGDFAGRPRPAVVVQSDLFNDTHASVTCKASQVMIDKITSVRRDRIGGRVGAIESADLEKIDAALRTWPAL